MISAKTYLETMIRVHEAADNRETLFQRLLLVEGTHFKHRTPSDQFADAPEFKRRRRPKIKQCFKNAQSFVLDSTRPDCDPEKPHYYEGYWAGAVVPVYHGWIVIGDRVLDFTAEACDASSRAKGWTVPDHAKMDYFGVRIPEAMILEKINAERVWTYILPDFLRMLATKNNCEKTASPC